MSSNSIEGNIPDKSLDWLAPSTASTKTAKTNRSAWCLNTSWRPKRIDSVKSNDRRNPGWRAAAIGQCNCGHTLCEHSSRAYVRRYGDWYNLDYYHHLAYGVRTLAFDQIGSRIEQFRTIVNNLIANDDLAPAKGFLESILGRIDAATDEAYRRVQAAGREAFKQTLAKDFDFWTKCENRWGQGPGYRSDIRDMTDEEFDQEFLVEVQKLVIAMLVKEWELVVELMEGLLQEKELVPVAI